MRNHNPIQQGITLHPRCKVAILFGNLDQDATNPNRLFYCSDQIFKTHVSHSLNQGVLQTNQ